MLYHLEIDREHLLAINRPGECAYFRSGLFTLRERDAIQVQLCATPAPTPEAVAAERTRGLK